MVGGEAVGNSEIKERRRKKKRHAEEKRLALAGLADVHIHITQIIRLISWH